MGRDARPRGGRGVGLDEIRYTGKPGRGCHQGRVAGSHESVGSQERVSTGIEDGGKSNRVSLPASLDRLSFALALASCRMRGSRSAAFLYKSVMILLPTSWSVAKTMS